MHKISPKHLFQYVEPPCSKIHYNLMSYIPHPVKCPTAEKTLVGTCNEPMRWKFPAKHASFLPALIIPHWIYRWWKSLMFCLLNIPSILYQSYLNGHMQFWIIISYSLIYFCKKKKQTKFAVQFCIFFNRINHYAIYEGCSTA